MRKYLILFSLCTFLISSCSSDDDLNESLYGTWYLQDRICFCVFPDDANFSENEIDFNQFTSKATVREGSEVMFLPSGKYEFEIQRGGKFLTIGDKKYEFKCQDENLILYDDGRPDWADDESTYVFSRSKK